MRTSAWSQCLSSKPWKVRARTHADQRSHWSWDPAQRKSALQWFQAVDCTKSYKQRYVINKLLRRARSRLMNQSVWLMSRRENWQLEFGTYIEDWHFVDTLALGVRLGSQVLVDVLKVGDCHIFLELFVQDDVVIDQLDFASVLGKDWVSRVFSGLFDHLLIKVF